MTNDEQTDRKDKAVGYGCLAAIVIPLGILLVWVFITDWNIRREIEKKQIAREALEVDYRNALQELDRLYDEIATRGTADEKAILVEAREYDHTSEEASHGGSDEYRKETFDRLTYDIVQLRELLEILKANPLMSPTEAKGRVKNFRCF